MMPYIKSQVVKLGKELHKQNPEKFTSDRAGARSVANSLSVRISRLVQQDEAEKSEKGLNALVPVDMIQAKVEEIWPDITSARSGKITVTEEGIEAAARVSIALQAEADGEEIKQIGAAQ
jgi:hypothetical protein